jgi:hypothetical protein
MRNHSLGLMAAADDKQRAFAQQQVLDLCTEASELEGRQSQGSAELYWLKRCHDLERQILLLKAQKHHHECIENAAKQVAESMKRMLSTGRNQQDRDDPQMLLDHKKTLAMMTASNTAALVRVAEQELTLQKLEGSEEPLSLTAANFEAAVSLLQFEESLLAESAQRQSFGHRRSAELHLPSEILRLSQECNELHREIEALQRDAELVDAYIQDIEKLAPQSPYSAELQALMKRCQTLALPHYQNLARDV